jgi:hypothetical protein
MTPLQIIATMWIIGTGVSFIIMMKMSDESAIEKKVIEGNPTFSPNTMRKILYIILFLQSFFMWPFNLGKLGLELTRLHLAIGLIRVAIWIYGEYKGRKRAEITFDIMKILFNKR